MKIWLKLIIGIILGIILGLVIKPSNIGTEAVIVFFNIFEISLSDVAPIIYQIGRYIVYPLVFFSLVIGTYKLQQEKKLLEVYGKMVLYLLVTTLAFILIGIISVLIFSPKRIGNVTDMFEKIDVMGLKEVFQSIFPNNFFNAFMGKGDFLLPVMVVAVILGLNLSFDPLVTRPVIQIFDSLSRIFYQIMSFIAEVFWIGLIVIVVSHMFSLREVPDYSSFKELLIILTVDTVVILFGIYPLVLYLMGEKRPYKWLYAITGPLLTAFATGDEYLSISMLTKHGKENLNIPRPENSTVFPVFAICGRAGTAMVAGITMFILIKSQSSLVEYVNLTTILWIIRYSFMVAFILGAVPGKGAFVAIALLCTQYERGIQEFYLMVKPIALLLVAFGVVLDVATSAFAAYMISPRNKNKELVVRNFI